MPFEPGGRDHDNVCGLGEDRLDTCTHRGVAIGDNGADHDFDLVGMGERCPQ
jgi:hypothetical protein